MRTIEWLKPHLNLHAKENRITSFMETNILCFFFLEVIKLLKLKIILIYCMAGKRSNDS